MKKKTDKLTFPYFREIKFGDKQQLSRLTISFRLFQLPNSINAFVLCIGVIKTGVVSHVQRSFVVSIYDRKLHGIKLLINIL